MKKKIKEGLKFSIQEKNAFVITVLFFAFIFSFNSWGTGEQANFFIGMKNLIINIFIIGISVLAHHLPQKFHATLNGFKAEHKLWWNGLIIGLLGVILTNGRFMFFAASGLFISKTKYRLGKEKEQIPLYDYGKLALAGPMGNIFLGATGLTMSWILGVQSELINNLFTFNIIYAFYNLLPFPPLDGSRMFLASRINYIFVMSSYSAYIALIFLLNVYSFIWATIIAYVLLILYYYYVEVNY